MASHDNKEVGKKVRAQIARRYVDSSLLSVTIFGSSVRITGTLGKVRSHPYVDLKVEMEQISQILRTIPGVRDVSWDVSLKS